MKKIICLLIILVSTTQFSCSQDKGDVSLEQVYSSYPIVLRSDLENEKIVSIRFYLTFDITNNTNEDISVGIPEYIYKGKYLEKLYTGWKTAIPMYFNQNGSMKVFGSKEAEGLEKLEKTPRQYIFLAAHKLSKDSLVQSIFSSYLEKMKVENKDTLHIGTISELKKQNSPIVQLLEGDSIIISFRGRDDLYRDPIPVQIK